MSFKGKRIFVTGAGRGLGAAFAVCLADAGAEVIMTGRNMENLTSLAESIKLRTGKRPETLHIDLADISQVTLTAKKMRDDWHASRYSHQQWRPMASGPHGQP